MKWRIPVIFLILGIMLVFTGGKGLVTIFVLPVNYITDQDSDWTKLKNGQSVAADFYAMYAPCCIYSKDGSDTSAIYVVPDIKPDENGDYVAKHYMGVAVSRKDFAAYDRLIGIQDYSNFTDSDYVIFDGYLRKLKKDERNYFVQYLKEAGFSDSEIDDVLIPYVAVKRQTPLSYLGMFGGGILCLAIGAVTGVLFFKKR